MVPATRFPDALPRGTRVGGLQIIEVINQGSFGITYLAREYPHDTVRAAKEFFPSRFVRRDRDLVVVPKDDVDFEMLSRSLQAFLREARVLERFRHPGIVDVHGYIEAFGTAFTVMAFVDGMSIKSHIESRGGRLPVSEALSIGRSLAPAVDSIHALGVVHRDIKPDNIMIRPDGHPVLIDFGAALTLRSHETETDLAFVTQGYSAPEQYTGDASQGPASDIYSLAAVLFRCITGSAPPNALARLEGVEPPPLEPFGETEAELQALARIEKCLALEVPERPASASALFAGTTLLGESKPSRGLRLERNHRDKNPPKRNNEPFLELPNPHPTKHSTGIPVVTAVLSGLAVVLIAGLALYYRIR